MKTLYLVRHAKSSKDDPTLPDRERPLNDRGMHDALKMGQRLAKYGVEPDLIVSSPARRALATAEIIAQKLNYTFKDIAVDDRVYESSPERLLKLIRGLDGTWKDVMLFGHNPEFAQLAQQLSPEIRDMPTCAVAEFEFDTKSWSDVGKQEPTKVAVYSPKD